VSDIQTASSEAVKKPEVDVPVDTSFFGNLDEMLKKLVPSDDVVIKDCWGKEVRLPSALPARRQIKVFRIFKEISEMKEVEALLGSTSGATAGEVIDVVMAIAGDEAISNKLGEAFTVAHPDVLDGQDPLDALPIEEIVAGLLPFLMRFLQRSLGAVGAMTEMAPQA